MIDASRRGQLVRRFRTDEVVGLHRRQVIEAVTPSDLHRLTDRRRPVRGNPVPRRHCQNRAVPRSRLLAVRRFRFFEKRTLGVDIRPLGVNDLAEDPLVRHVDRHRLEEIVNTVFQQDAMFSRPFRGVDQAPAVVDALRRRDFNRRMLARRHDVNRHLGMIERRGEHIDQIEIVALAHPLPGLVRAGVDRRFGTAFRLEEVFRPLNRKVVYIANRADFDRIHPAEPLDRRVAAIAEPDITHAQMWNRRRRVPAHIEDLFTVPVLRSRRLHRFVEIFGRSVSWWQ